jgi:hypothetical protein
VYCTEPAGEVDAELSAAADGDEAGAAAGIEDAVAGVGTGTVRSLKQYRHLMASSWISSAQYGHFFTVSSLRPRGRP